MDTGTYAMTHRDLAVLLDDAISYYLEIADFYRHAHPGMTAEDVHQDALGMALDHHLCQLWIQRKGQPLADHQDEGATQAFMQACGTQGQVVQAVTLASDTAPCAPFHGETVASYCIRTARAVSLSDKDTVTRALQQIRVPLDGLYTDHAAEIARHYPERWPMAVDSTSAG